MLPVVAPQGDGDGAAQQRPANVKHIEASVEALLVLQVLPLGPVEVHQGPLNVVVVHVIDHGVKLHFQPTCNLTWEYLFDYCFNQKQTSLPNLT